MPQRRTLVAAAAAGAALATAARPAVAQGGPEITWRCTSSFPRTLDTIYGAAEVFARTLAELTDGRFKVEVFPAGAIAPALEALDAVAGGTAELCHTCSYYFFGKDPTFAFGTGLPFGLNSRLQNAWLTAGGGNELLDSFYARYGVRAIVAGNTGVQMGGWFRRDIRDLADLRGLRMRIGGLAGQVVAKLGVEPQQIAGGEIYAALEAGRIDAAEWVGPHDDEKLGFWKVAKNYYYPGWWESGTAVHLFFNKAKWDSLPEVYRAACRAAAAEANSVMQARYDVQNPAALKRLVTNGVELKAFPTEVMQAAFEAATGLYDGLAATNAEFRRIYEPWKAFRADGYLWWLVNEIAMDAFMVRARAAGRG
jgi:TRAP-type mannitol/chloroaromatic compound transport system substrate-binding protein